MNKNTSIGKQTDLAVAKAATLGRAMDSLGPAVVPFLIPDKNNSKKSNADKKSVVQPVVVSLRDGHNKT